MANFILMLTQNDQTVAHAHAAYAEIADCGVRYVGFKDVGLPFAALATLTREIRRHGQQVMLEVVSTTRAAELDSVRAAIALGVDYLLGGRHAQDAIPLLQGSGIRYFPFCGRTVGHPTRLTGSIDEVVEDARRLAALPGVHGLDLLAYRFGGEVEELMRRVVGAVRIPVIAAGSIDCAQRIQAAHDAGAWGFTIGSALFERRFLPPSAAPRAALREQVLALRRLPGVAS